MIIKRKSIILLILLVTVLFSVKPVSADNLINMTFKGTDLRDVLRSIADLADVNLVTDGSVQGNITIHLNDITFTEALKLITTSHNLAYKWDNDTVIVATPERIDGIYSSISVRTIPVNFADLAEVKDILTNVYPELLVTRDQRNHKLIFKGKSTNIEEAEKLLKKLDTQKEKTTELIPIPAEKAGFLKSYIQKVHPDLIIETDGSGNLIIYGSYYDIENANKLIKKLIDSFNKIREDAENLNEPKNIIDSIRIAHVEVEYIQDQISKMYPDLNIIADTRNNQLIFNGFKKELSKVRELVARIDLKNSNKGSNEDIYKKVLRIEYANIDNIETTLAGVSPSLNIKRLTGTKQLLVSGNREDVEMAVSIGISLDREQKKYIEVVNVNYASLDDVKGIISDLYPEVGFRLNKHNNNIIINGTEDELKTVTDLIAEIDLPNKQVIIEARVEEISTRDLNELGINADQLSKIAIIDDENNGLIDSVEMTIPEIIKAIEEKGSSNTLANPRLMTLSGKEAKLLIGDRIPVPVETVQDGQVTSSIEYIEAGINLIFTPWVTSEGTINLEVKPQVSTIGESIGTSLPPINTREAETNIILKDGQTFAIGGLIQDDVIEKVSQVPILADIPIFGALFKSRKVENLKTELIIFITPHIVNNGNSDSIDNQKNTNRTADIIKGYENHENGFVDNSNQNKYTEVSAESINKVGKKKKVKKELILLTDEELNEIIGANE